MENAIATLVIDLGETIIGIYSVEEGEYQPYRSDTFPEAISRIGSASEVVTYSGKGGKSDDGIGYDLEKLAKFAGLPVGATFSIGGEHTDMREIIWSARIWGSSLLNTYIDHFDRAPVAPEYEDDNKRDCYMTFKLWELWKRGGLKRLDGQWV